MFLRKGKTEQELFFEELRGIQDFVIEISLCKQDKYKNKEEMLKDVTYETIYRICEMMDGYGHNSTKYKLVNTQNGNVLNENLELHDRCIDYLRCTDARTASIIISSDIDTLARTYSFKGSSVFVTARSLSKYLKVKNNPSIDQNIHNGFK